MAIVPSGWAYLDASTGQVFKAGTTMPIPEAGDMYYGLTPSGDAIDYSKLIYTYYDERTLNYYYDSDITGKTFIVPAGWGVSGRTDYTMTSASVLSNIAGKDVVSINFAAKEDCKITSIDLPPTIVVGWFDRNKTIKNITGSISSAMKYFTCYNSTALTSVPSLINATNIINGIRMFQNCSSLTTVPALPPNIKDLTHCFSNCTSIQNVPDIPQSVINITYMCYNCGLLETLPVNNSNIIQLANGAFYNCTGLTDASNFNIPSSAKNIAYMFYGCDKLIHAPAIIKGSNAAAYRIFENCTSLITPPVFEGSFSTLETGFGKCSSLKIPPVIKNLTNCAMGYMFSECISLEYVPDLPRGMITANKMFYGCTNLTWNSIYIPTDNTPSLEEMFQGCIKLTGIIWIEYNGYTLYSSNMFKDTEKPIILWASERVDLLNSYAASSENNVHVGLIANSTGGITAVRCNIDGEYDDKGDYTKLTIKFIIPNIANSKLYVPKVYIKNDQQKPIKDWTLTYNNGETDTTIIIEDSTDITQERIEACDISMSEGTFTTLFNVQTDVIYNVYIPTSCNECTIGYDSSGNLLKHQTYYWSGTVGQAIFTGDTYIFDALPDGSAFKIGGPIVEDRNETGFIVGDPNIPLVSDQYPSTFNGPVTFNSNSIFNNPVTFNSDVNFKDANNVLRALFDFIRPVGSTYSTLDANFDPNVTWGGTWEKLPEGYVLLSGSEGTSAGDTYIVGEDQSAASGFKEYGSNTHTLSMDEMPSHDHNSRSLTGNLYAYAWMKGESGGIVSKRTSSPNQKDTIGNQISYMNYTINATHTHDSQGGGQAHSIMQKSIAVYWWIRTA